MVSEQQQRSISFWRQHGHQLSASAGPRYLGFVTGGTTPAALLGDWLVSAFDQNAQWEGDTIAPNLELEALRWLADIVGIPVGFDGITVTGATMANFVGLATGRQWLGEERGVDLSETGLHAMHPVTILSGTPHSSIYKVASMLGLGSGAVEKVATLPGSEAVDPEALESRLVELGDRPVIVVGNAGIVNNGDFDDFSAIGALKKRHPFWFHVDGAFGLIATASPQLRHLAAGLDHADSITVDGHKWVNVPYDGGYAYTKALESRLRVFRNAAPYLSPPEANPRNVLHLGPENSRRWRALPLWFALHAYGAEGLIEIVERCCSLAREMGERIGQIPGLRLAAPVQLNITCIELEAGADMPSMRQLQRRLVEAGEVFATPSIYQGRPIMRLAFSNWRTSREDLDRIEATLRAAVD